MSAIGKPLFYYHGTSDTLNLNIGDIIKPAKNTGILREDFRTRDNDIVFSTFNKKSARYYAKKAVEKFGGNPIIFIVNPDITTEKHRYNGEITSKYSTIISILH